MLAGGVASTSAERSARRDDLRATGYRARRVRLPSTTLPILTYRTLSACVRFSKIASSVVVGRGSAPLFAIQPNGTAAC